MSCKHCSESHLDLEFGAHRPEPFLAVPGWQRPFRTKADNDLCRIDGKRFFLRGLVPMQVIAGNRYDWGLWAEVSRADFENYLRLYSSDSQGIAPPFAGTIANELPIFDNVLGLPVSIQLVSATKRPELTITDGKHHTGSIPEKWHHHR